MAGLATRGWEFARQLTRQPDVLLVAVSEVCQVGHPPRPLSALQGCVWRWSGARYSFSGARSCLAPPGFVSPRDRRGRSLRTHSILRSWSNYATGRRASGPRGRLRSPRAQCSTATRRLLHLCIREAACLRDRRSRRDRQQQPTHYDADNSLHALIRGSLRGLARAAEDHAACPQGDGAADRCGRRYSVHRRTGSRIRPPPLVLAMHRLSRRRFAIRLFFLELKYPIAGVFAGLSHGSRAVEQACIAGHNCVSEERIMRTFQVPVFARAGKKWPQLDGDPDRAPAPFWSTGLKHWVGLVLVAYLVLTFWGVTTSSLASTSLQDDGALPARGLILNSPDAIRSDEYLRGTPAAIGVLLSGGTDFQTPLASRASLADPESPGLVTDLLFIDGRLEMLVGKHLPEQAFAFAWWLPAVLVAVFCPVWLALLGVDVSISVPSTLLILAAPSTVWWSLVPLASMGFAFTAAALGLLAVRALTWRQPVWLALLWGFLAAVSLARLAFAYQPWAIPLGAAILIPTAAVIAMSTPRRLVAGLTLVAITLTGLVIFGAVLAENRSGAEVVSSTVYPGSRRLTGRLVSLSALLAAPHLWRLQTGAGLVGTNQSEVSSAYLVLAVAAFCLLFALPNSPSSRTRRAATATLVTLGVLLTWSLIDWPERSADFLYPMNLVSAERLAQVSGLAGTAAFALALQCWKGGMPNSRRRWMVTAWTAGVVGLLTGVGGSSFRQLHMPDYRSVWIFLVAALTALAVGWAIAGANRAWAMVPLLIFAASVTGSVMPVQVGFSDLRDGSAAAAVNQEAAAAGGRWATDDIFVDALLMANAVPSLSGQQTAGPNYAAWQSFAPRQQAIWNRGASYVVFQWQENIRRPTLGLPSPDMINVTIDPCSDVLDRFDVRTIVSSRSLDESSCLSLKSKIEFGGRPHYIYRRA